RAVAALAASVRSAPACTYLAGVAGPGGFWVSWIGDSRAYWLPDDGPGALLTEDDTGELDALAAWLGADAGEPAPGCRSHRPSGSGRLLLCTDGLWRYLPDPGALRAAMPGGAPPDDARAPGRRRARRGAADNVTALLVRLAPPRPGGA
ncbi:PP2C family protein-serine/threonine phosphatase, partial [Actinomadura sp. CNU-125]|uniref:PP2C family protein-serine/threonine phosphatase n=1 Tax=Actinomadura sp. CNU-125 TaxID=1904961 RepID=UPI00165265E9